MNKKPQRRPSKVKKTTGFDFALQGKTFRRFANQYADSHLDEDMVRNSISWKQFVR